MKKVYVCSPYRGDKKANIEKAKKYSWRTSIEGTIPITPHLYFTQFLDDDLMSDRSSGLRMGRELLKECDEVHVFADEVSEGMISEIKLAQELNIPIKFYNSDMEEIAYESLIINRRIGPGYRQIIEDAYNPGSRNRICPFAGVCNGKCEEGIEDSKESGSDGHKHTIIIKGIRRN